MRRSVLLAATAAALIAPSVAAADTYCVTPATGCDSAHTVGTLTAGLAAATSHAGADVVQLGAATYAEDGLDYSGSGDLEIRGAGRTTTTVRPATGGNVLDVDFSTGLVTISDLRVLIAAGSNPTGIDIHDGTIADVTIGTTGASSAQNGIRVQGAASITRTTITSPGSACVYAGQVAPSTVTIQDTQLSGCNIGIASQATGPVRVRRTTIAAASVGLQTGAAADVTLDSTLIRVASGGVGVQVGVSQAAGSLFTGRQVTIVGSGDGTGVHVFALAPSGGNASATFYDSIIRSFAKTVIAETATGKSASFFANFSDLDLSAGAVTASGDGTESVTGGGSNLNVDPQFLSPTDLRPGPMSPVIDRDTFALAGDESPTDLDGNLRIIGGSRDFGAYERALVPVASALGASGLTAGEATLAGTVNPGGGPTDVIVDYGPTGAYGTSLTGDALAAALGDQPVSVTLTGLAAGTTYHARLRATNRSGTTAGPDVTFTTSAAPPPVVTPPVVAPPPTGITTAPVLDLTKPGLRAVSLSRTRFRVGPSATPLSGATTAAVGRTTAGATLRFTLSEAATVTVAVHRLVRGVRSGGRCRTPRSGLRGTRCTLARGAGALRRTARAGRNAIRFSGRIARKALRPGRYRLTLTPRDSAGNRGTARRVTCTIVRR